MTKVPELSSQLQALTIITAEKLARSNGFTHRQLQIMGSSFAQTLVLGGLSTPQATRRQQTSGVIHQVLEQRFTLQARDFMRVSLESGLMKLVCRG